MKPSSHYLGVAMSHVAVQYQYEPQRQYENAPSTKSVHGVPTPTYPAGLRPDAGQPAIYAKRQNRHTK